VVEDAMIKLGAIAMVRVVDVEGRQRQGKGVIKLRYI
jgi:hypothetical protein